MGRSCERACGPGYQREFLHRTVFPLPDILKEYKRNLTSDWVPQIHCDFSAKILSASTYENHTTIAIRNTHTTLNLPCHRRKKKRSLIFNSFDINSRMYFFEILGTSPVGSSAHRLLSITPVANSLWHNWDNVIISRVVPCRLWGYWTKTDKTSNIRRSLFFNDSSTISIQVSNLHVFSIDFNDDFQITFRTWLSPTIARW